MPKVSLLLVCYNSEKYVGKSLGSYLSQDIGLENIEIIIADGGSSDKTVEKCTNILEKSNVKYKIIENTKRSLASGWNLAIKEATGEFVCRVDSHSELSSNYIKSAIKKYSTLPDNTVAIGGVLTNVSDSTFGGFATDFYASKFGVGNSPFRIMSSGCIETDTSVFAVYRRGVFENVGYFNEELGRNQDIEFHKRVIASGYKMYTDYSLVIFYYVRSSFKDFVKKAYSDGFWVIESKSYYLRHLVPLFFFLYSVLSIIIGFGLRDFPIFLVMLIYLFLVTFFAIKDGSGFLSKIVLFTIYPSYHISYGFGSFVALLNKLINK